MSNGNIYIMLSNKILTTIRELGKGCVFTTKDFSDIACDATVRKTLSRLAEKGTIRRIRRGVYDYPAYSKMLGMATPPDPDAIAKAIAREYGWTIVPTGDAVLNLLGLSTQVPAKWRYVSDGPTRKFAWEGGALIFQHRANREMTGLSPNTAMLVQALKALGAQQIGPATLNALRARFNTKERARAAREARYVTSWIYEIIRRLAEDETNA